jgi:hypothetical protein
MACTRSTLSRATLWPLWLSLALAGCSSAPPPQQPSNSGNQDILGFHKQTNEECTLTVQCSGTDVCRATTAFKKDPYRCAPPGEDGDWCTDAAGCGVGLNCHYFDDKGLVIATLPPYPDNGKCYPCPDGAWLNVSLLVTPACGGGDGAACCGVRICDQGSHSCALGCCPDSN